ncbi:muts domain V-domain-containing protein [Armillaria fumosa]|nr:muts domain V-domain-containing protein [Armillaria fumosa]
MKNDPSLPQTRISSYFSQASSSSPSKGGKNRSSPIDLTGEADSLDSEPPPKKRKITAPPTPVPPRTSEWKYTSGLDTEATAAKPPTEREIDAKKKRQEAFRKKLLADDHRFSRRVSSTCEPEQDEVEELSGGESDDEFKALTKMFSVKGQDAKKVVSKKAVRTQSAPKVVEENGPCGQPYTPLEKQVLQLKKENAGTVLMIEVGYKYRFFGDDAKIASKELGMVSFNDRNFLVASIPSHRRDIHLKKLLSQGYRVGIVQQTETAALKKVGDNRNAPFERKLTGLYTATTFVDGLDSVDDVDKYVAPPFMCIVEEKRGPHGGDVHIGLISICPSTGDVIWDAFEDTLMRLELETRLSHTKPAELLLHQGGLTKATEKILSHFTSISSIGGGVRVEHFQALMPYTDAYSYITDFYAKKKPGPMVSDNVRSGKILADISDLPKSVVAALAHSMKYLSKFGLADAFLETNFFTKFSTRAHMLLAANTLQNLEIYRNETDYTTRGSLMWILDRTKTRFGARLLRYWVGRPLVNKVALRQRIDAVEEILASSSEKLVSLRQVLKGLPDLAKGLCRIHYGQCTPQELAILIRAFKKIADSVETIEKPSDLGFHSTILNDIIFSLQHVKEPVADMLRTVNLNEAAGGKKATMWVDPERYPDVLDCDLAILQIEAELDDELKASEFWKTVRRLLKFPSLQWSTISGDELVQFLVEVKKSDNRPIPDDWHRISRTKYLERYQPLSVKHKVEERNQGQESLKAEAHKAYLSFLAEISQKYYGVLRNAVTKLAVADCLLSLAHVALLPGYVKPSLVEEDVLEIVDGRHPMVEALRDNPFVPNTVLMGGSEPKNKIITGPNMGGKSSSVRMVALIAVMAQVGSYVPATSVKINLLDSVLTRMGASDDLARGRSTFMVEMAETSEILHSATERSLVILDELGRGTSTFDGMAIADAVLQHLVRSVGCKTLFITHYPSIALGLEKKFPKQIHNLHMGYEAETRITGFRDITFLYRLTSGIASESFGVECGALAGLPESLLSVAAEHSSQMKDQVIARTKRNKYA